MCPLAREERPDVTELKALVSSLEGPKRKRALKIISKLVEELENAYEAGRWGGLDDACRIAHLWGGSSSEDKIRELFERSVEEVERM